MRYYSTNRYLPGGFGRLISFKEALFLGQAPDGGLFMPERIPDLDLHALRKLKGRPYAETAFLVLNTFLKDDLDPTALHAICEDAYDFPVPLEPAGDLSAPLGAGKTWIIRLDQGPTASFKDFAARFLARTMRALKDRKETMTVLVATSGDTGGAVGDAFKGLPGVRVFILYPAHEVSPLQKRQLDTIDGNVQSIALEGKFDDCQNLVKRAFSDPGFRKLGLTSANSINFGRILPQAVYYAYAWNELAAGEPMVFSVPSGNFGDAFGCELMRRMGLPVKKLILATNDNDEFPRFLKTGLYEKISPSLDCLSNAMNVGHPSNLARFFDLYGGTVDKNGVVYKPPDRQVMLEHLYSTSVSDDETRAAIKRVHERLKAVLEPHGAVGWVGLERYRAETGDLAPAGALETAHPAKFPETIREVIGIDPEPPPSLRDLADREGEAIPMHNDYAALKKLLLERA